ncbi:MAG: tetratricopeptide repeat protein [Chloroflexota bacterium]
MTPRPPETRQPEFVNHPRSFWQWFFLCLALIGWLASACTDGPPDTPSATPAHTSVVAEPFPTPTPLPPTATPSPSTSPTATATALPTATETSTATATPTASPSPTATPPPDTRLRLGIALQAQGNYPAAIDQYQALIDDPNVTAETAAEARYRLGQCQTLNDDPAAAAAAFQAFLAAYPDDARRPEAHFQLAEALAAQGAWQAAIENYQLYLAGLDAIASHVQTRIGDAYVQLGDDEQALESYRAALESAPYLDQAFALRERVAEIHIRAADMDQAIAQYQKILEAAESASYRAQMLYLLGQAWLASGNTEAAHDAWREAVERYPRTHHAYLSLVELVNAGVAVDEFQRGLVDFYAGVYGAATQAFYRYLDSEAVERRDEARYYVGRAYHLSGNYALAIDEYDTVIAAYPDSPVAADAWLEKARSLAAQDQADMALETLEAFVQAHPENDLAPEALWRAAQIHQDAANWAGAAAVYRRLHADYSASERAAEALFDAGLCHYRLADYRAAADDWQTLVADYASSEWLSAARYWLSKAHAALGDDPQRDEWLTTAATSRAFLPDYYSLRAAHRAQALAQNDVTPKEAVAWPSSPPNLLLTTDQASARAAAEAWLLKWADPAAEIDTLDGLTDSLASDPRYRRAVAFLSIGLRQKAVAELEALRLARWDDPLAIYGLALAARDLEIYDVSIRCALRVVHLSPAKTIHDAPHFLLRLIYPIYYADLVLAEAAESNLDPLLLFALMRQESLFSPDVASYAQAIGLMQIIPSTGEWIALRLRWQDFVAAHLTRPYLNIHFGAWFLAQALDTYQGNVFAALASYNAGMAAPARWLEGNGGDPDLFVETIDFSQTLHYVQLIYQHHTLYRQIYQSDR